MQSLFKVNKIDVFKYIGGIIVNYVGEKVKFVCFNIKEPKVGVVYDVLDDLKKECEIKLCKVGEPMVFVTKDSTNITTDVVSVNESFSHILVETRNSFYAFEK